LHFLWDRKEDFKGFAQRFFIAKIDPGRGFAADHDNQVPSAEQSTGNFEVTPFGELTVLS